MSHLQIANQTYEEHFYDSMGYCLLAIEAGIYFFIHALLPNTFTSAGSRTIKKLYEKIEYKLRNTVATSTILYTVNGDAIDPTDLVDPVDLVDEETQTNIEDSQR
jgi:hypothetical protein